jgi:hypothetical protein
MRQTQTEPKISVIIQPKEEWINWIYLVIQNIGLGQAYNIKFEVNPDFEYEKGKFLSELGLIKNGLRYLAPNQIYPSFLTSLLENFEGKKTSFFEIKVTYQDSLGKTYEDKYSIDFSELIGMRRLGQPHLYKIANSIEKIEKDINYLTTGFHKMQVVVYTKKEIEEEMKQYLESMDKSSKDNEKTN